MNAQGLQNITCVDPCSLKALRLYGSALETFKKQMLYEIFLSLVYCVDNFIYGILMT